MKENTMTKKIPHFLIAILFALSLVVTGCGDDDEQADSGLPEEEYEEFVEDESVSEEEDEEEPEYESDNYFDASELNEGAFTGEGAIQVFVGEEFYDGTVTNEEEALELVTGVLEYIGGDDTTSLELAAIDGPTEEGNTYYTFSQIAGDIKVYGASLKLVTDKDGHAIGLNSTLVPDLNVSADADWRVGAEDAEAIVKEKLKEEGLSVDIVPNVTEATLLPIEERSGIYYYAWVVYTRNYYEDVDTAYLAHYVDSNGEYLYCNPVTAPGNKDALSGSGAAFTFEGLEADTWTGKVKKHHGGTEEVTIPVAKNPKTGEVYLADVKRKIMCADYADFVNNDTLTARVEKDGKFTDNEVLIYRTFTEIYDFYTDLGWEGPDGTGSPVLLLMDWVDEDGEPVENACYSGKIQGFDVFQFNRNDPDGETYDIMAHEYTHALTGSAMITNLYLNDYGAINEAMSDIFGNLVESLMGKTKDKTWLISENGKEPIRSMSQPHLYDQPEHVWDKHYVPPVSEASENNDNGGVHINSSLLNLIAYRLNESGMPQEDQLYFWLNVALILTPRTDYEQLSEILPWSLKVVKMEEYMDVLNKAIDETGIADRELPEKVENGLARFQMVFPDHDILESNEVMVSVISTDNDTVYNSWAEDGTDRMAVTVDPGSYMFVITVTDKETGEELTFIKNKSGWTAYSGDELQKGDGEEENCFTVKKGEIIEFDSDELNAFLKE